MTAESQADLAKSKQKLDAELAKSKAQQSVTTPLLIGIGAVIVAAVLFVILLTMRRGRG